MPISFPCYRPEYYGIDEWDDEERTSSIGQAEFIVAKHRNGGLDNIPEVLRTPREIRQLGNFDSPYEFPSKMNETIAPEQFPSAGGPGSSFNEDDGDVPLGKIQPTKKPADRLVF